jgi:hypothetical protein
MTRLPGADRRPAGDSEDVHMAQQQAASATAEDHIEIDLRNPALAAFLAWLWPGAGHIYQRRYAKGVLFMVCVLSTYFFGLSIAGGRVVYASWKQSDRRWQYVCQLGVGAAALPALWQSNRVKNGKKPLFNDWMAPPETVDGMAGEEAVDGLSELHLKHHAYFELGTLYTMIAGLLNVLAIYDAYAGPAIIGSREELDRPPPEDNPKGG